MAEEILIGLSVLGIVFLLVIVLGLQIQISTLTRRLDDLIDEMRKRPM